jgi:predicted nucleotidyltransferase
MDWNDRVVALLQPHPLVRDVRLTGSRGRGDAGPLSDWDFEFELVDFPAFKHEVWRIVDELRPLVKQWDRLGEPWCLMLIVDGPVKIDLIFDEPHDDEPPWIPSADNLQAIDDHFWDWTLWLGTKVATGKDEFVATELERMHEFLLGPLGIRDIPKRLDEAVAAYLAGSAASEERYGVEIDRRVGELVTSHLRTHGILSS